MFEIFDIMFDISSLSVVIAAIAVMIGVVLAVLELRNMVKTMDCMQDLNTSTMKCRKENKDYNKYNNKPLKGTLNVKLS